MSISKKRIKELKNIKDEQIDYSDIPELDESFWENAKLQRKPNKKTITIRIDPETLEFYKSKGKGYQTFINDVLRSYALAHK